MAKNREIEITNEMWQNAYNLVCEVEEFDRNFKILIYEWRAAKRLIERYNNGERSLVLYQEMVQIRQ